MNKRRKHSPQFKAKVALEAARIDMTVNQIASKYQVHPTQVSQWKRELIEGAVEAFTDKRLRQRREGHQTEVDGLHRKIGELSVELDWLKKKLSL